MTFSEEWWGTKGIGGAQRDVDQFVAGTVLHYFGANHGLALRNDKRDIATTTAGAGSPTSLYPNRVALIHHLEARIRAAARTAEYQLGMVIGGMSEGSPWNPNVDRGHVVLDWMTPNIAEYGDPGGFSDPNSYAFNGYVECLLSAARWLLAAPGGVNLGIHDITAGTSGVWTPVPASIANRGSYRGGALQTIAAGAYRDINFADDALLLWNRRYRTGYTTIGGELEVVYDPASPGNPATGNEQVIKRIPCHSNPVAGPIPGWPTGIPGGFFANTTGTFYNQTVSPLDYYLHSTHLTSADVAAVFPGQGFAPSGNVVRVRKRAGDVQPVVLEAWATPGPSTSAPFTAPPRLYLMQSGYLSDDSPQPLPAPTRMHDAYDAYRAAQSVVATRPEFTPLRPSTIDLPDWLPNQMIDNNPPYIQWADRGHEYAAEQLGANLHWRTNTWDRGVQVL